MAGKMLGAILHSRKRQSMHQSAGQVAHHPGVRVKRALTDDLAAAPIQIKHWCKTKINAHCA